MSGWGGKAVLRTKMKKEKIKKKKSGFFIYSDLHGHKSHAEQNM